jgi:hypothetical protein
MAFRKKKPFLNLNLGGSSPSSAPSLSSGSDCTPHHDNTNSASSSLLAEALPSARYDDSYERAEAKARDDSDDEDRKPANPNRGAPAPPRPALERQGSDQISDTSYRSPSLGLSIGASYVRVRNPATKRVLALRNSRPWARELRVLGALGRGACSTVYKAVLGPAKAPPADLYAVKTCPVHDGARTGQLLAEINLLARLSCPCLVQFDGAYYGKNEISLVLEYMNLGDLGGLARRGGIPDRALAAVFQQVLFGLGYLHWYGLVHRDVKPGNILLSSAGYVKLSDFGIASSKHLSESAGAEGAMNSTVVACFASCMLGWALVEINEKQTW